jgi:transposase
MNKKYPDEFKQEVLRQVVEKGYSVPYMSERLVYLIDKAKIPASQSSEQAEIRQLKAELERVTKERNIPNEAVYFASESKKSILHKS